MQLLRFSECILVSIIIILMLLGLKKVGRHLVADTWSVGFAPVVLSARGKS